jgi:hypothetical protein
MQLHLSLDPCCQEKVEVSGFSVCTLTFSLKVCGLFYLNLYLCSRDLKPENLLFYDNKSNSKVELIFEF